MGDSVFVDFLGSLLIGAISLWGVWFASKEFIRMLKSGTTFDRTLAPVRADDLAGHVIRSLMERNSVPPEEVDDVLLGCTNQAGEDNRNVARMGLLLAGLPVSVPG